MWFWINKVRRTVGKRYDSKALSDIFILNGEDIEASYMYLGIFDPDKRRNRKYSLNQKNYLMKKGTDSKNFHI